eukprot:TRINITY_DN1826_c0_g1_i1.p1 TRINITY_DN1826_c0_g1~~TRINITY_DN1826_c0_g1_i1.p1  ORF type:complete len:403 (+),score=78.14 TRINITY_DN1826_c0_g1_i1:53-1261(+)
MAYAQRRKSRDVTAVVSSVEFKSGSIGGHRPSQQVGLKVKAMWDYVARDHDELTLKTGDIVENVEKIHGEWWKGQLRGKIGLFPANYVVPVPSTSGPVVPIKETKQTITVNVHMTGKPCCKTLLVDGTSKGSELINDIFEALATIGITDRTKYRVLLSVDEQPIDIASEIMKQPRIRSVVEKNRCLDMLVSLIPTLAPTPAPSVPVAKTAPAASSTGSLLQKYLQGSNSSSPSTTSNTAPPRSTLFPQSTNPSAGSTAGGISRGPSTSIARTDNILVKSALSSYTGVPQGNQNTPSNPSAVASPRAGTTAQASSSTSTSTPTPTAQKSSDASPSSQASASKYAHIKLSVNATNPNAASCAIAGCAFRRLKQTGAMPVIFCKNHQAQHADVDIIQLLKHAPTS